MPTTEQQAGNAMIGGLAHKIRDPLAAIKLFIEVLLTGSELQEKDRTVLHDVVEEIRRIELLMKQLLNYSQPADGQLITVNVNKIIEVTAQFLEKQPAFALPSSGRKIVRQFAVALPDTVGDPQQLQQVFLNLLLNAAEAMPDGGIATIKTWCDVEAGRVYINLSDTGRGIPTAKVESIFQPFFTTKVRGIGLGLAVAKKLVEAHGGSITATGAEPVGATFKVVLPLMKQ